MFLKIVNIHDLKLSCIEWVNLLMSDFVGFPLSINLAHSGILICRVLNRRYWLSFNFRLFLSSTLPLSNFVVASTMTFSVAPLQNRFLNLMGYGSWPKVTFEIQLVLLLGWGIGCRALPGLLAFLRRAASYKT